MDDKPIPTRLPRITVREFEIWRLIAQGNGTKSIALKLGVAPKTIDAYKHNLKKKLGVSASGDLAPLGWKHGLAEITVLPELKGLGRYTPSQQLLLVNSVVFAKQWAQAGVKVDQDSFVQNSND